MPQFDSTDIEPMTQLPSISLILRFVTICSLAIYGGISSTIAQAQQSPVELSLLTGDPVKGELLSLTEESVALSVAGETKTFPRTTVLSLKLTGREKTIDTAAAKTLVTLTDGTAVKADAVTYDGTRLAIESSLLGELQGKGSLLHHVRYAEGEPTTLKKWSDILSRETKQDVLVIKKEDSIDFFEGIISKADSEAIYFLLNGEEVPVDITKVFGIVLGRNTQPGDAIGSLVMTNNDRLPLSAVTFKDNQLSAVTSSGMKLETDLEAVELIDFRQGRLVYLSELEPRTYEYTPFFGEEWKMRVDENFDRNPIRVGNQTFTRGLCIHSKTLVRYRLASGYRRFQAVMGIDELVGNKGHVHVVIKADDDILYEGDVRGSDAPIDLDYDVSNKRDLEILVDFGADLSIADHLALGNARLIK